MFVRLLDGLSPRWSLPPFLCLGGGGIRYGSGDVQIEDNETAALMEGGGGRRQKPQKRMGIAK